jgi:hypothetical protein
MPQDRGPASDRGRSGSPMTRAVSMPTARCASERQPPRRASAPLQQRVLKVTWLAAFALAGFAGLALAQTDEGRSQPGRVELWGGVSTVIVAPAGALVSAYSPPLLFTSEFTSHGGQALTLDARRGLGFAAGVNVFPTTHFGVQVLTDRASTHLTGTNGPYAIDLTYISRQPPTSEPQTFTLQYSIPWPDTSGSLTQLAIAVNSVARVGPADRLNATISGGLSYYRLSGTAQPLGYTTFRLGGHSVLFSDEYHLAISIEPTAVLGFNAGGEINVPLGRHGAVVIGYRYLGGPTKDVPVRVSSILNADQVANEETAANVEARLAPAPARVGVSGSRLLIGLKVKP